MSAEPPRIAVRYPDDYPRRLFAQCCQCLREAEMVHGRFGPRAPDGWVELYAKEGATAPVSALIRACPECIEPEPRSTPIHPRHFMRGPSLSAEEFERKWGKNESR